jgi:hypothetical protein
MVTARQPPRHTLAGEIVEGDTTKTLATRSVAVPKDTSIASSSHSRRKANKRPPSRDQYVAELVRQAPPLTDEQREALTVLLAGAWSDPQSQAFSR